MGKIVSKIDNSPTLSRMLSLLPNFVMAITLVLGGMGWMLDVKIKPFNDYMAMQATRQIEKQYYKITNNQDDIKPIDLLCAIEDYACLPENYKKAILDDKAKAIREYNIKLLGGLK